MADNTNQAQEIEIDAHLNIEKIQEIIIESVSSTLGKNGFNAQRVDQWVSTIIENILKGLQLLGSPFKYVVTCTLMQKTGGGIHTATQCHWDGNTDAYISEKWENQSMQTVTTVYGLAI